MPRAYLRLDPGFDERKHGYPDGPYAALIATFCLAEQQPDRGRFRSLSFLKALLGSRGRHAKYLLEHGDLIALRDGRIYVVGWDEWQEGDWKVGERVQRIRNRRRTVTDVTPPTVTSDSAPTVYTQPALRESLGSGDSSAGAGGAERSDSPQPPASQGARANGENPRAEGTSPRQLTAAADRRRTEQLRAITWRYRRGEITEEEERAQRAAVMAAGS